MSGHNVNWENSPSEYQKRYGKYEKHSFDGKNGPKIPCKYPDKGPMLYEVMQYYSDLTKSLEERERGSRCKTTDAYDDYVYPRETRSIPRDRFGQPSSEDVHRRMHEQQQTKEYLEQCAERPELVHELDNELSEAQREEAWLAQVTEQHTRRMRITAGYHPDVSTGTRGLFEEEPEPDPEVRYGKIILDARESEGQRALTAQERWPPPSGECADLVKQAALSGEKVPASEPTLTEFLQATFPSQSTKALQLMTSWLEEDGICTVEAMAVLEGPNGRSIAGKERLIEMGLKKPWVNALQAKLQQRRVRQHVP